MGTPCSTCGTSKNSSQHIKSNANYHVYSSISNKDRRSALRRIASKGIGDWRIRKAKWMESNPLCQLREQSNCWGVMDAHHIIPRGAGGTSEDTSPLATLCRLHHQYVEEHREWARGVGLLIRRESA